MRRENGRIAAMGAAGLLAAACCTARAETYYLTTDTSNKTGVFTTLLGTYWKTADGTAAESFAAGDVGRIENGTLGIYAAMTFPGDTLHLGSEDGTRTGTFHFRNHVFTVADLRWHSGAMWRNYGGVTPELKGTVRLDCPDGMHNITNGYGGGRGIIFSFPCAFVCDDPAMTITLLESSVGANCLQVFSGDNSGYRGRISQQMATTPFVIASADALGDPATARADALSIDGANAVFAVKKGTTPNAARGIAVNASGFKVRAKTFQVPKSDNSAVRTTVDCSAYELPMPIGGTYGITKDGDGKVTLSGTYAAGDITVAEGTLAIAASATFPSARTVTVKRGATLLLSGRWPAGLSVADEDGATLRLEVPYDAEAKTTEPVALPSSYTAPPGGLEVALSTAVAVPQHEALELEVLTVPAGAADVSAADFSDATAKTCGLPKTSFRVTKDADGTQHVWLAVRPVVKSVTGFYTVDGTSKTAYLTVNGQANTWSDGAAAHAGADYLLAHSMNSLSDIAFAGDSLTVSIPANTSGTTLHVRNVKASLTATIYPPTIIRPNYGGRSFDVSGDWTMAGAFGDGAPYATLCSRYAVGNYLSFGGALHGEGPLKISAEVVGTLKLKNGVNQTRLDGDNSDYRGRLCVTHEGNPTNEYVGTQFGFGSAAALGGALATFRENAITLDKYSMMCPSADITFDTANRGICSTGPYGFNVPDGVTFTVKAPIRQDGTMYKTGAGTLALGGAISFGTNDLCKVREGGLSALADAAVAGLDCTFADGTSIVLSPLSAAANGFRKVTADGKLKVALALPEGDIDGTAVLPVCTVPAADADLTDSLEVVPVKGCRATLLKQDVTVDGAACVRYSVQYMRAGLVITVR